MPSMILKENRDRNRPMSKMPRAQLTQAVAVSDRIRAISDEIRARHNLPPVGEGETLQGARKRLADEPAATIGPRDHALSQIQTIAYDGTVQIGERAENKRPLETSLQYQAMLEAKIERICNIAEAAEPDEDWDSEEIAAAALLPCGCTAGAGGMSCARCRPAETGGMSTSDGLGADAEVPGAGELRESGWPVDHMSPNQIELAYAAEGDRNHEETDGERRRWEHEIQPFADTLHQVRELAQVPEDASTELLRSRLAVIRGKVPPAVWTLVG